MHTKDDNALQKQYEALFELAASNAQKIDVLARKLGAPNVTLTDFSAICTQTNGARLLSHNFNRRSLLILNNSTGAIVVHIRNLNVNDAGHWFQIAAGRYWEPLVAPVNEIYILGTLGTTQQVVGGYEGT